MSYIDRSLSLADVVKLPKRWSGLNSMQISTTVHQCQYENDALVHHKLTNALLHKLHWHISLVHGSQMTLSMSTLSKRLATHMTYIWFLSCVDSHVIS